MLQIQIFVQFARSQPGALPSTNQAMVEKALMLCLAMNSDINMDSFFDRKNYLYADLPGGYQVTQNDRSIGRGGYFDFLMDDGREVRCHIHNLHMEEDAGKTKNEGNIRLIDMNRCGVPLVEMVTMPDLHSADEAATYLTRLRQLLRWLGISEANMEKAHLRCDANVSIAPKGSTELGKKCEIKNINSIEAVRMAINYEIERQIRKSTLEIKSNNGPLNGTMIRRNYGKCALKRLLRIIVIFASPT